MIANNMKIVKLYGLVLTSLKMAQSILDNGNMDFAMAEENNYGKMDQFMKAIGKTIWLMVKDA